MQVSIFSNLFGRYYFNNIMKGKFVVLEGLDRSGKSSITKFLQQKLTTHQTKALSIGFPNRKSPTGLMINDFLSNKTDIQHEAIHLLFSANRWEAKKGIQQALQQGNNIVCDRYWYSGVAYSYAKGLDFDWCINADKGLTQPDLVIFLKGDPIKLSKRQGYGHERFEKIQFQQKVSQGFNKLIRALNKDYIKVVNIDDKSLQQIKEQVFKLVEKHFEQKK